MSVQTPEGMLALDINIERWRLAMFKTIVVAVDGSSSSDRALEYATQLAKEQSSQIVLAHVTELIAGRAAGTVNLGEDELVEQIRERAAQLSKDGVNAEVRVARSMTGGPAHAIAEIATEANADVIVTGTRGHTVLTGMVIGSVAQRMLHVAPCPVLVVPEHHAG
jgi:nucleotide-binding universal stress UspA family protein